MNSIPIELCIELLEEFFIELLIILSNELLIGSSIKLPDKRDLLLPNSVHSPGKFLSGISFSPFFIG
jgi:hypothetical protein